MEEGLKNMEISDGLIEYMETYSDPENPEVIEIIRNEGNIRNMENTIETKKKKGIMENIRNVGNMKKYTLLESRGKGTFGEVWKARNSQGNIVALKLLKSPKLESLKKEIEILAEISKPKCNPFLACYYGSFQDGNIFGIEMEYIDGKELDKWANSYRKSPLALNYNLILLMRDLSEALLFLHKKNFIHRDIKPANILITAGNFPKLVDFGIACHTMFCRKENCCYGRSGTPVYASPEVLSLGEAYYASDIWSLGASIYYAATGNYCFPFDNARNIDETANIIIYTDPYLLKSDNKILNQAVNQCLIKDFNQRININSLQKILYSPLNQ